MSKHLFFDRELSWLEFNQRVLEQARDTQVPLLERLKFLAIASNNLDEFCMVRVGTHHLLVKQGVYKEGLTGLGPSQLLKAISARMHEMVKEQYRLFHEELVPQLESWKIQAVKPESLSQDEEAYLASYFEEELFPLITPMVISGNEGVFPNLQNLALFLAVRIDKVDDDSDRVAVLPLENNLPRFISIPTSTGYKYMLIEDAVRHFLHRFFPKQTIFETVAFRVTRNADLELREDQASDLLAGMEEVVSARKTSDVVRLEIEASVSHMLLAFLQHKLQLREDYVFSVPGPIDFSDYFPLAGLEGYDTLNYTPWQVQHPPEVPSEDSVFDAIRQQDILLNHPYESFDPIVRLLEEAADDPAVLAIKQILYRTSKKSPVVGALIRAAEKGKNVTALVELKARFDEERNIEWAKAMEAAGVQVIYGIRGYKTHAKICIVVRRETDGIRRYMHFGTGNYNEATAKLYGDISYLTCDPDLGLDASSFFNTITGYSQLQDFRKISMSPDGLKKRMLQQIEVEIALHKQGQPAAIKAKLNSLLDPDIIDALYKASQAGVQVDLNIRGICTLRPGVEGLSEHIRVVSIVDRYLEHARVIYFHHGGNARIFISSADWMPRNLHRRIELLTPIETPDLKQRLYQILCCYFEDTSNAWALQPDGSYQRVKPSSGKPFSSQLALQREAEGKVKKAKEHTLGQFQPYQSE